VRGLMMDDTLLAIVDMQRLWTDEGLSGGWLWRGWRLGKVVGGESCLPW